MNWIWALVLSVTAVPAKHHHGHQHHHHQDQQHRSLSNPSPDDAIVLPSFERSFEALKRAESARERKQRHKLAHNDTALEKNALSADTSQTQKLLDAAEIEKLRERTTQQEAQHKMKLAERDMHSAVAKDLRKQESWQSKLVKEDQQKAGAALNTTIERLSTAETQELKASLAKAEAEMAKEQLVVQETMASMTKSETATQANIMELEHSQQETAHHLAEQARQEQEKRREEQEKRLRMVERQEQREADRTRSKEKHAMQKEAQQMDNQTKAEAQQQEEMFEASVRHADHRYRHTAELEHQQQQEMDRYHDDAVQDAVHAEQQIRTKRAVEAVKLRRREEVMARIEDGKAVHQERERMHELLVAEGIDISNEDSADT